MVLASAGWMTSKTLVSNQGFKFGSFIGMRLVEFNEIASVRITHKADLMSDTDRTPKEYMNIKLKDGATVRFGLSDPVDHAAGKEIIKMMERRKIPVSWESGTRYYFFKPR
jgi:alpha/beta superfamily hydrolase